MTSGWIKFHRQIIEKSWFSKSNYVHVWCYLLIKASFSDKEYLWNGESIKLKPGQFVTGRKQISKDLGIPETTVERILTFFQDKEKQIGQQKTSTSRLISILNYAEYQDRGQQTDSKRTASGQRADTNKEGKEREEGKEISYAFGSNDFKTKYGEWVNERKKSKKPLTENIIQKQMAFLAKYSEVIAISILEKSIMNGWQGLFDPTGNDIKVIEIGSRKNKMVM